MFASKNCRREMVLRERERKARTTLLMAIPEDHLAKFHKMTDAKDMWIAIKSRFGGNDESKRCRISLEIMEQVLSTEDANQKFLRSLPSAWLQVSLIMRNKPGMDSLSFDDFTNEVSTAYGVSHSSGHCLKHEQPSTSSYSLLASQSSCPQLDHEDLDQNFQPKVWSDALSIEECESDSDDDDEKCENPLRTLKNKDNWIVDCSKHMSGTRLTLRTIKTLMVALLLWRVSTACYVLNWVLVTKPWGGGEVLGGKKERICAGAGGGVKRQGGAGKVEIQMNKSVGILVDLPYGRRLFGTSGVYRQEEGIDYDEVFAPVARIEAIQIFLAFASYMGFIVYQMDVKSAFMYGKIDEEVYVSQPPGFIDPKYPKKAYKVVKHDIILVQVYVDDIIFGSIKKSWCDEFEALMKSRFQMSSKGELSFFLGLQVKQKEEGIFISQDKYVAEILRKFNFVSVKTASTPIETQKPLVKDEEASDVDVHLYRSMIGSLMYLTASRPDIMFAVCACSRVSLFDLEAYSDSNYAGANLDRKSTTKGCQFLGKRLIYWQCKKQTIVATSTTEAEYVAAASCCGQVLWIQNQMLDYGFNFMNTKIYIDNESTICIVKNPVYHSKTKHIAIRHHFIRDAYEKKLIQVLKIHTDDNVADLLTKAFDVSRGLKGFRELLSRATNGTTALLLPTLFFLWLDKVSTVSVKLVPLGKVCTALELLKKNTAEALISTFTTLSISSTMAVLDSCPKHNMVAYLEKTEGNEEFHDIIDFLKRSSIHFALTVSPTISTTFVEQFWTSAKSTTINNVRHITAKVAGKSVSISEASIRSDLRFDDADGIDTLPNQAIFNAIQQMGYEGDLTVLTFNKALFSPQWRFLFHTINHCLSSKSTSWDQIPTNIATAVICLTSNQKYNFSKLIFDGMLRHLDAKKKFVMYPRFISIFLGKQLVDVSVPLDHFPVNTLTSKVFSFMVKKGKHFSGKVTPLFASMLVQPTQDEGASSERPSEALPTPSPAPTSEVPYEPQTDSSPAQTSEVPIEHQPNPSPRPSPTNTIPASIPETSGDNLGGHSSSDKSLSGNEGDMTIQGDLKGARTTKEETSKKKQGYAAKLSFPKTREEGMQKAMVKAKGNAQKSVPTDQNLVLTHFKLVWMSKESTDDQVDASQRSLRQGIEADRILAAKLKSKKREQFTIEEKS
ncbi:putative ribonuclease H-like domain-containing protein [Tanacetum coccineum]